MGSRGSFLKEGGFSKQEWEQVGTIKGVKILRKIGVKEGVKGDLPYYSNTPGTAYILLNSKGIFSQYRQHRENREPEFDLDYGIHDGKLSLHIHYFENGKRSANPEIIAYANGDIINEELYKRYRPILKGVKL